jgi:hypothetical protein
VTRGELLRWKKRAAQGNELLRWSVAKHNFISALTRDLYDSEVVGVMNARIVGITSRLELVLQLDERIADEFVPRFEVVIQGAGMWVYTRSLKKALKEARRNHSQWVANTLAAL